MNLFQEYIKIDEVAKLWNITPRRVQSLCAAGKIEGAMRFGRDWMIPKNAQKPVDGRTKAGRQRQQSDSGTISMLMSRQTPFLHMTDLYSIPGEAEECIAALANNPEAQTLLAAEIAYSKGQIDKVYDSAYHLLFKHSGFML